MFLNKYIPMINNYTKGEGLITFISEDIAEMSLVLEYMTDSKTNFIDSAAPMYVSKNKLMLTTTSLIFLNRYGLLDKLNNHYEVYILSGLVKKMKEEENNLLDEIKKAELKERFALNKQNDNNIENLNKQLDILKNIKEIVDEFIIVDIYPDMTKDVISSIIPHYDVSAAEYAKIHGFQLIVDDAATMGLIETFVGIDKLTNSSGILNKLLMIDNNFYSYFELLNILIKDRYLFAIDFRMFCYIIDTLINDNNKDEIVNFVNNLLDNDYDQQYNRLITTYTEVSPKSKEIECEIIREVLVDNKKNL